MSLRLKCQEPSTESLWLCEQHQKTQPGKTKGVFSGHTPRGSDLFCEADAQNSALLWPLSAPVETVTLVLRCKCVALAQHCMSLRGIIFHPFSSQILARGAMGTLCPSSPHLHIPATSAPSETFHSAAVTEAAHGIMCISYKKRNKSQANGLMIVWRTSSTPKTIPVARGK